MKSVLDDGFTTAPLKGEHTQLWLALCVHCDWLAAGSWVAVTTAKNAHRQLLHADLPISCGNEALLQ